MIAPKEKNGRYRVIEDKHSSAARAATFAAWTMLASALCCAALIAGWGLFDINTTWVLAGCAAASACAAFTAFVVLRERQVPAANSSAAEASEEKLRLLATMSHEVRTPLNGVVGMINLLLETPLSAEQRNYAATANSSARTLLSIVDEALDTAKDQASAHRGPDTVQLRPLIENVTELLAARAHAKSIELSAYIAPEVPAAAALRDTALRQILFNLIGNAIKFTEKGGVSLTVSMAQSAIVFDVTDTGIGMSPAECERAFAEFQQANEAIAQRYGGTGLGLSITRRLVALSGGTMAVKSAPGQGTTFTVTLPQVDGIAASAPDLALAGRTIWIAAGQSIAAAHAMRMAQDLGGDVRALADKEALKTLLSGATLGPADHVISVSAYADVLRGWARTRSLDSATGPKVWVMLTAEERRPMRDLLTAPFAGYLLQPLRLRALPERLAGDGQVLRKTARKMRAAATPKARKLHVLVADDNAINILLVSTMLKKFGHRVAQVSSGQAALDLLGTRNSFDCLLLDVEMPGLSGYETARLLRQDEESSGRKRLPVLALTAHKRTDELEKCLAAGMDGYLTKPLDPHDLDEALAGIGPRKAA